MISLLPGQSLTDQVVHRLRAVAEAADHARTVDPVSGLLEWVSDAEWMLQHYVPASELDRLVRSPRYWEVISTSREDDRRMLAATELEHLVAVWRGQVEHVHRQRTHWHSGDVIVVLDATAVLHLGGGLHQVDWHALTGCAECAELRVVLPIEVIDHLDRLVHSASLDHARQAGAARDGLAAALEAGRGDAPRLLAQRPDRGVVTIEVLETPSIGDRALAEVVIERAVKVRDLSNKPTVVLGADLGTRLRARRAGLRACWQQRVPTE